jgi:hypothetical protein
MSVNTIVSLAEQNKEQFSKEFVAWLMYEACFNNKNFFHVRSRKLILALLQVFLPAKL